MAMADYRLCDVCGCKTFYDSNLNYAFPPYSEWDAQSQFRIAGADQPDHVRLERLGDWAVLCIECAKTHKTQIVKVDDAASHHPKETP